MFECNRSIHVSIRLLFKWHLNIASNRYTAIFISATVCCFHNAGTATGHCYKSQLRYSFTDISCSDIKFTVFFKSCRAKYCDAGSNKMKFSKAMDKLPEYSYGKP